MQEAGTHQLSAGQRAPHLLGHLEADVRTELEHFTHLFRGRGDQGDLLHGS